MSTCITLPFWPACLDNMRWSDDNLIAVAASDAVAILVPTDKTKTENDPRWEPVIFKVNGFTQNELPLRPPLSFANWSVGEELSLRYVLAMDWSPPGLGCFGSCVLAILHSDYALDLWEHRNRPDDKDNWKRCLVITTAVHDYYESVYPPADQVDPEFNQVRQRIRSFAWGPGVPRGSSKELHDYENDTISQTVQLLAVATEAGDILILRISSPYNTLSDQQQAWQANVLHRISCSAYMSDLDHAQPCNAQVQYRGGDYAVMDELLWTETTSKQQHVLAFITSGVLCCLHCDVLDASSLAPNNNLNVVPQQITPRDVPVEGPLRLSTDNRSLICFAGDMLTTYKIPEPGSTEVTYETTAIDRKWSEMSGLVVMPHTADSSRAMFTTHLGYERLQQDLVVLSGSEDTPAPLAATTQDALQEAAKEYVVKADLGSDAHTRTWGLVASPLNSHVAICSTLLPSDSMVHMIQSDQECKVFICELAQFDEDIIHRPQLQINHDGAETLAFILQSRLLSAMDTVVDAAPDADYIRRALSSLAFLSPIVSNIDNNLDAHPTTAVVCRLRKNVLARTDRCESVKQRLLNWVQRQPYTTFLPNEWYQALIEEVQAGAASLPKGQLSDRILHMYGLVHSKLVQAEPNGTETTIQAESCSVCQENMPFEAIKWARCPSGHRFTRCALTFLAIPRPGISKTCVLCSTQYLNEWRISELGAGEQSVTEDVGHRLFSQSDSTGDLASAAAIEPAGSLARVLFSTFDRCILCNARFVA